jgi:hypothetical protein
MGEDTKTYDLVNDLNQTPKDSTTNKQDRWADICTNSVKVPDG